MSLLDFSRWASRTLVFGQPWALESFSNPHFRIISAGQSVEEERLPDYVAAHHYPIRIGELFASLYQVVGKLGFGTTSTVWLARDLTGRRHVALKIFTRTTSRGGDPLREVSAYRRLEQGPKSHLGRQAVRTLLDSFNIICPNGKGQSLVHPPLWDSVITFLARNPVGRLPTPVLAIVLQQVLRALDYARECQIIHTGRQLISSPILL